MRDAVYVGQFGAVWKLRREQWLAICEAGAKGRGYDLTPFRRLKRPPRWLVRDEECRGSFWSPRSDVAYVEPLDWEPDDFADHLRDQASMGFGKT